MFGSIIVCWFAHAQVAETRTNSVALRVINCMQNIEYKRLSLFKEFRIAADNLVFSLNCILPS